MEKVLVTGGGGFIGKALVRGLVKRGVEVAVVGRNHYPELAALGVQCHQGDIRDLDFLGYCRRRSLGLLFCRLTAKLFS